MTKRSRSQCDVFGFSANNNWILMSCQSRPQAQKKRNRIQHEFDRDSGVPPSRQHETWRSRTRLFFYDEHLKMTVSQREITEKHISNALKSEKGHRTAHICSRNQWLCERDGSCHLSKRRSAAHNAAPSRVVRINSGIQLACAGFFSSRSTDMLQASHKPQKMMPCSGTSSVATVYLSIS